MYRMAIKGFNSEIIEPYYISNLLQAKPGDKDVYHCSIYLICKNNLKDELISELMQSGSHSYKSGNDVVTCVQNLIEMNPSFEDYINFISDLKKESDSIPFHIIMSRTAPFIIKVLSNRVRVLSENEPSESEKEKFFKDCFGLDDNQIELIRFSYFISGFPYGIFENHTPRPKIVINAIAQATFLSYESIVDNLTSDSRLSATGIIQFNDDNGNYELPRLAYRIIKFIEGTLSSNALMNKYSLINDTNPFPLESFTVSSRHTNVVKLMLSSPECFQILLYGEPGTGKTEYAKSIALALGKRPRFILTANTQMFEQGNRLWALHITLNTMTDSDLLIIDEADDILNSERENYMHNFEKGQINSLFDSVNKSII